MKCRIQIFHPEFGSSVKEFDKDTILIGRQSTQESPLDIDLEPDRRVSRLHGKFLFDGKSWYVEDLQSHNGIYDIMDGRITHKTSLYPGSEIVIGGWHLILNYGVTFQDNVTLPPVALETDIAAVTVLRKKLADLPPEFSERFISLIELTAHDSEKVGLSAFLTSLTGIIRKCLTFVKSIDIIKVTAGEGPLSFEHIVPPSSVPAPLSRTLAEEVLRSRKAFLLSDTHKEAPESASLHGNKISAAMYIPLVASGSFEGILCISSAIEGAFQNLDLAFASTAAFVAAARIYETRMRFELRDREKALANVRPHFPEKLWRYYASNEEAMKKRREIAEAAVMYVSVRGLRTSLESRPSRDVLELLNDLMDQIITVIHNLDGITQATGCDEIAAYFGLPEADGETMSKAAFAAVEIQRKLRFWREMHKAHGLDQLQPSIGIHAGQISHGFSGPQSRLRYLISGEPVNVALHLARQALPGQILMSLDFLKRIKGKAETGPSQEIMVPGENEPLCCCPLSSFSV
jgi:class 3 adenylate cyclase